MKKTTRETAIELARKLRMNQTPAEVILWNRLRNRKLVGRKFLRQHPIFFQYGNHDAFFIADFYCHEHRLVLEVDGKRHDYQKNYDAFKTHIINALGINVMRFKNDEIESNIEGVLIRLREILTQPPRSPFSFQEKGDGG